MFEVGDIVVGVDVHSCNCHDEEVHFGRVKYITKSGMFRVELLENVPHYDHAQSRKTDMDEWIVVTPGENVIGIILLTKDGVDRGRPFGNIDHIDFEKYDPSKVVKEVIDKCGA